MCLSPLELCVRIPHMARCTRIRYSMTEVVMCMITADCMVVVVVFNATFNNISAISWRSELFVEETVHGENHGPVESH
jgi:hypothetical protein